MKLLLDNNLSPKIVAQLADIFPNSSHVALLELDKASDRTVWQYAKDEGYCLVSKDSDFNELLNTNGFPPKLIWIRLGNCTTAQVLTLLQSQYQAIQAFLLDDELGILELQ